MGESVRVVVRCRPMNNREKGLNCKTIISIDGKTGQCAIVNPADEKAPPKTFTFDGAYDVDSITESIYADIGYPLVEGVTEGYNGTIFAYGQTGAGKSFSMQGISDPATQRGIIPRAFDHIFETIQVSEGAKYLVHASYLEIYNEEIRDLLSSDIKQKLELKERPDGGVFVQGLGLHPCKTGRDCERIMEKGWSHRSVGATLMNADSSRSHSIFTIHLERCDNDEKGDGHIRAAKLNLVDLAGSERQSKTGATGDRLKEATKINLSLSALGNVISALVDGKSTHIPYRDSKLTRLLQDSLGGNTKTLMVACLSPADNNYDETLSTLRYANRAKNIKNKPKINEDPKDALLREYQDEIQRLKSMLQGTPEGGPAAEPKIVEKIVHVRNDEEIESEKLKLRQEFEQQMAQMKEEFVAMKMSKEKLEEEMGSLRDTYDRKVDAVYDDGSGQTTERGKKGGKPGVKKLKHRQQNGHSKSENGDREPNDEEEGADYADDFETEGGGSRGNRKANGVNSEQQDAMNRLRELQQQFVGGEQANNEDIKLRRQKKKKYAEERKRKLQVALAEKDGDDIIVDVYDNVHEELRVKTRTLEKQKQKNDSLQQEMKDLSTEFEADRNDYLETIRKQEQQAKWYMALVEAIHPCLRRDCNYVDLDRVRVHSVWDEERQTWVLPKMTIEKTKLPPALPGMKQAQHVPSHGPSHGNDDDDDNNIYEEMRDDKYLRRLQEREDHDVATEYFRNKRADKLLAGNGRVSSSRKPMNGSMTSSHSSPGFDSDMADMRAANNYRDDGRRLKQLDSLPTGGASLLGRRK